MNEDLQPHPEQIKAFKRMSAEQKFDVAAGLFWATREIKAAQLRSKHPEWSADQIEQEVRLRVNHARS